MLVLVLSCVLLLMGTVALRMSTSDIVAGVNYKRTVEALYIAEAGIAHARQVLGTRRFAEVLAALDTADTSHLDSSLHAFVRPVEYWNGSFTLTLQDNDDGDGEMGTDADNVLLVRSTGEVLNGGTRTIEVLLRGTRHASAPADGAIRAAGPVETLGTLVVDGRDHDLDGLCIGSGTKAISTRQTYDRSGNSKVAGTDDFGFDYAPTKVDPGLSAVTETNQTWDAPGGPDDALGLAPGTLKMLADEGRDGSQYVTDPDDLTFPLSGITYVDMADGATWNSVKFGNSSGVLVVHSSATDATISNINSDTFTGIVIGDDIVHIHCRIVGQVIQLSSAPSSGNCIGNGKGEVLYSTEAIGRALGCVGGRVTELAWREL
jgi:hypothetical protein